jgi:membrane protein implicated in regulation of membrane protease activity
MSKKTKLIIECVVCLLLALGPAGSLVSFFTELPVAAIVVISTLNIALFIVLVLILVVFLRKLGSDSG